MLKAQEDSEMEGAMTPCEKGVYITITGRESCLRFVARRPRHARLLRPEIVLNILCFCCH